MRGFHRWHHCCQTSEPRTPGQKARRCVSHGLVGLGAIVAVAAVLGGVTMTAWNLFVPTVFGLPVLTFWQALGLLVLGRLLTGSFHRGGHKFRHGKWSKGRNTDADSDSSCATPFCCDTVPPQPDSFAEWWWSEGSTAYKAFRQRQTSAPSSPTPDTPTPDTES